MRCETEYTLPAALPGDLETRIYIDWEIYFEGDYIGNELSVSICATPIQLRADIGEEPFCAIPFEQLYSKAFKVWIDARKADLTFEKIGYTEREAAEEYAEQEADRQEEREERDRLP